MAEANRAEVPRAVQLVGVRLGVKNAIDGDILSVQPGVFGMDVEDGVPEGADTDQRVHPLPEQVRRIVVDADRVAPDLAPRMERVTVAGERADLQPAGGDRVLKPLPRRVVGEQYRRVCVLWTGKS